MNGSRRGIALLIVLWVMTVLMVMVFSFSVLTRAESFGTLAFKGRTLNKFHAEAGIERGIMEMIYRAANRNQRVTLEGRDLWKVDGTAYTIERVNGGSVVRIYDEAGKISLNALTPASGIIVKNLLMNQGTSPEDADIIVDSILDWKDADDLHRLSGAESDYYQSLPKPYKTRNADFETLEELILVRGVTPEILFGTEKRKGIIHFLTVQGKTVQINVNAAPKEVLAALPGMDAAAVETVISLRTSSENVGQEIAKTVLGAGISPIAPYVSFAPPASSTFTVESTGYTDVRGRGYSIVATVVFDTASRYRYLYHKSPAEITQ